MDIMKAILDIESKAQGIINTMSDIKTESEANVQQELKRVEAEMECMAVEKIAKHKAKLDVERKEKLLELENFAQEKKIKLEQIYSEKRSAWVEEIFNAVAKGDSV